MSARDSSFLVRTAMFALLFPLSAAAEPPAKETATLEERRAADAIRPELIRAHVRLLADDLLEGRGPATRGDRLAELYIATQMEAMGLVPGGDDGSWYQSFDIVGVTSHAPATVSFTRGGKSVSLSYRDDVITAARPHAPQVDVKDAELVFVGYGIVAPEYGWDDFKDVDVRGKVLVVMNNDPENDPELFAGKTRLFYGRWDYKYEQAARKGAVAAIIIHTPHSAGYPWQVVQTSWSGESFSLPRKTESSLLVQAWTTEEATRRITTLAGMDLDALRAKAESKDFRPVPLGVTWSLHLDNDVSHKKTENVIGKLPGSDPELSSQAVFFTAHHDHLGIRQGIKPGQDAIYNGAVDNASGVAGMLAIARAMTQLPTAPRRTVLFAAVAAEEQGLLGSEYLAGHPPVPAGRIAADINIDGIGILGRTRDFSMIGLGKSSIDDTVRALVTAHGRTLLPDQFPDKGAFYRSDQFNFARVGVPSAYFKSGTDVIGKPEGWGRARQEKFVETDYHQPSDELRPDWDLSGAVEDCRLILEVGLRLSNAPGMPEWKKGDEFEAARKKALAEVEP